MQFALNFVSLASDVDFTKKITHALLGENHKIVASTVFDFLHVATTSAITCWPFAIFQFYNGPSEFAVPNRQDNRYPRHVLLVTYMHAPGIPTDCVRQVIERRRSTADIFDVFSNAAVPKAIEYLVILCVNLLFYLQPTVLQHQVLPDYKKQSTAVTQADLDKIYGSALHSALRRFRNRLAGSAKPGVWIHTVGETSSSTDYIVYSVQQGFYILIPRKYYSHFSIDELAAMSSKMYLSATWQEIQVTLCISFVLPWFLFSMVDPLIRYAYFGFADAPSIVVRYAIAYELLRPVYELRGVLENVYKRNRVFKADVFVTDLGYGAPLSKALAKSTGQTSEESSYVLDPLYSLCYCDPSVEERFKALQKKSK